MGGVLVGVGFEPEMARPAVFPHLRLAAVAPVQPEGRRRDDAVDRPSRTTSHQRTGLTAGRATLSSVSGGPTDGLNRQPSAPTGHTGHSPTVCTSTSSSRTLRSSGGGSLHHWPTSPREEFLRPCGKRRSSGRVRAGNFPFDQCGQPTGPYQLAQSNTSVKSSHVRLSHSRTLVGSLLDCTCVGLALARTTHLLAIIGTAPRPC